MSGGLFVGVEKYLIGGITDATKGLMMSYSSMMMGLAAASATIYIMWRAFLPVTEPCLLNLSDYYNTLVSDTHIQVSVPPTVYSYRNGYDKWCTKLFVDKNKLHILKHQ